MSWVVGVVKSRQPLNRHQKSDGQVAVRSLGGQRHRNVQLENQSVAPCTSNSLGLLMGAVEEDGALEEANIIIIK